MACEICSSLVTATLATARALRLHILLTLLTFLVLRPLLIVGSSDNTGVSGRLLTFLHRRLARLLLRAGLLALLIAVVGLLGALLGGGLGLGLRGGLGRGLGRV